MSVKQKSLYSGYEVISSLKHYIMCSFNICVQKVQYFKNTFGRMLVWMLPHNGLLRAPKSFFVCLFCFVLFCFERLTT
jgi:hypothetical protein